VLGLAWTGWLWGLGGSSSLETDLSVSVIAMLPVLGLAAVAGFVRSAPVLVVAAVVHGALIASSYLGLAGSGSSTAGVGLVIAPLISVAVVVPGAALAGWALRRFVRR